MRDASTYFVVLVLDTMDGNRCQAQVTELHEYTVRSRLICEWPE
jgi:hypothetical protein